MMKLRDIGIGNNTETAQPPVCNCGRKDCKPVISGDNFKSKEEVISFAIGICEEWECNHVFAFIKFKDNTCAIGFKELVDEEADEYKWNVYKIKWNHEKQLRSIRQFVAEYTDLHFATVLEENKDGDFVVITE